MALTEADGRAGGLWGWGGVPKESGFCSFDGQDQVCVCLPCSEVKVPGKAVVLMEGLTGLSKMAGEEKSG